MKFNKREKVIVNQFGALKIKKDNHDYFFLDLEAKESAIYFQRQRNI